MGTGRVEAFSDAVLAIIMTIMVLELRVPHEADLAALRPLLPVLLSYVLSFVYLGIYWNDHHLAIGGAFVRPEIAEAIYVLVALMWLIPDSRIERALAQAEREHSNAAGAV